MKTICTIIVCSVLAACTAVDPGQEPSGSDQSPGLGTVESDVLRCGIGCPAGSHPEGYFCNSGCGDCSFGNNQTDCRPNTGTSFTTCDLFCPAPYQAIGFTTDIHCLVSATGSLGNNETFCHL